MHAAARPQPAELPGTQSPDATLPAPSVALSGQKPTASVSPVRQPNPILRTDVGAQLHGCRITAADHELERQILDLDRQASAAYAAQEVEQAKQLSTLVMQAMASRRPEVVAAWAEDERLRWEDGAGFFSGAQAQEMGRAA